MAIVTGWPPTYDSTPRGTRFLTELLRSLEEERVLVHSGDGGWRLGNLTRSPVPELVRQVIDVRVSRLGDTARDILEVAAVIGNDVSLDLWTELIDVRSHEFTALTRRIVDARVLSKSTPNSYRFSHALVREAIYDGTSCRGGSRCIVRLPIGSRPETGPILTSWSTTFSRHRTHVWRGRLLRAGLHARRRFAPQLAVERFTAALAASDSLSATDRIMAYLERGRAHETLGELVLAIADAEAALELARQASEWRIEWQTLLDLGAAWSPRNYDRAGNYDRQALDLARAHDDPVLLATSLNRLGNWFFNVLRLREALDLHQEALTIFERLDDLPHLADTHDCLAMSWWGSGDSFRAAEHWDAAIALFERLGDRQRLASSLVTSTALSLIDYYVVAARPVSHAVNQNEHGLALAREIDWRPVKIFGLMDVGRLRLLVAKNLPGSRRSIRRLRWPIH